MLLFQGLTTVEAIVLARLLVGLVVWLSYGAGKRSCLCLQHGQLSVVVWPCDTCRMAVRIEGDVRSSRFGCAQFGYVGCLSNGRPCGLPHAQLGRRIQQ